MMGSAHVERNGRYAVTALMAILAFVVMARLVMLTLVTPVIAIILIWMIVVPISYRALAEEPALQGLPELPAPPPGLNWQKALPRRKRPARNAPRHAPVNHIKRVLSELGYRCAPSHDSKVSLIARSADGASVVVKICEGQAGVLACQDALKAMLKVGAHEAIVFAPNGPTPTASRFLRQIRSRRGVRIRIWSDANLARPARR